MRRPWQLLLMHLGIGVAVLGAAIGFAWILISQHGGNDTWPQLPWTIARILIFIGGGILVLGKVLLTRRLRRMKRDKTPASGG